MLLSILHAALFSVAACTPEKLNPRTLCPTSGSKGQTILLIDSTDPLTPVSTPLAYEGLKQLFKGFRDSENDHYLPKGNELVIYHLAPQLPGLAKPMRVCNPGDPSMRTWLDNLLSGKYGAWRNWKNFEHRVLRELPDNPPVGQKSPLLETIALIVLNVGKQRKPTSLIVFSDMLQNSDLLSHYKTLPEAAELKKLSGLQMNLKGVNVWLYYVQRTGLENVQTRQHYYWWTRAVQSFGGKLVRQVPL